MVKKPAYGALMLIHALTLMLMTAEPSVTARYLPVGEHVVGGAMAPAALPAGTLAFWGLLGAPDLGVGYRQGFATFELDANVTFNYLTVSTIFEAGLRLPLFRQNRMQVAALAALGLELNSGSTYYDRANFSSVAMRPRLGVVGSYQATELVQAIALVDVPWAISMNVVGSHFAPTIGAGAEIALGGRLSLLALGQIGADVLKAPLGVTQVRPAWAFRLGFGYRMF